MPSPRKVVVDDEGSDLVIEPMSDQDRRDSSNSDSSKEESGILPWISIPPPAAGDNSTDDSS